LTDRVPDVDPEVLIGVLAGIEEQLWIVRILLA
jgi:hypothetical protein